MEFSDLFATPISEELDESIRVDRALGDEERLGLLDAYRLTEESRRFLMDFFQRAAGGRAGDRKGFNSWLYGYYGSGKSHLLAVLGFLMDSAWVARVGRSAVWEHFAEGTRDDLHAAWTAALDHFLFRPLFVNLLRHQARGGRSGRRKRQGFAEVLLRAAHERENLSPRTEVAFFEKWYRRSNTEEAREERARAALRGVTDGFLREEAEIWPLVQRYQALSEVVLPHLFEEQTGTCEGLRDVTHRTQSPDLVIRELERWRERLSEDAQRPVKLLLLLDEVSLFIGGDTDLLTELNALAEKIDEVGQGNILCAVTAQESLTEENLEHAARRIDFSILYDRFPHQHALPPGHVGEIIASRLLEKTADGAERVRRLLQDADVRPADALVYRGVQQNTTPRLDEVTDEDAVRYFPLLPYHPPLFLEILSRLRTQEADRSKSIFSGTARAILALAKALLEEWAERGQEDHLVSLVDFFEVVREELKSVVPQEIQTIEDIEHAHEEGALSRLQVDICKAVLLLQRVPAMIPLDRPENIAAAVMRDLNGTSLTAKANQVSEALTSLRKYVRPAGSASGAHLQFTTQEERRILEAAERHEQEASWQDLAEQVEEHLWEDVLDHLDLQTRVAFPTDQDTYGVAYSFWVDGHRFERPFGDEEGLAVPIFVAGLFSDDEVQHSDHLNKLVWIAASEEREAVRARIRSWAALVKACADANQRVPETIEQDVASLQEDLPSKIAALLRHGTLKVRGHEPSGVMEAVGRVLRLTYDPKHVHPEMLRIDADMLSQLKRSGSADRMPQWAKTIEVPYDSTASLEGFDLRTSVRAVIGRALHQHGEQSVQKLLARAGKKQEHYKEAKPALVALMWGLCRRGDFQPVDASGALLTADDLLEPDRWDDIKLRPGGTVAIRDQLEKLDFVRPSDTNNEALVALRRHLQRIERSLRALCEEVTAARDLLLSVPARQLLGAFTEALEEQVERARETIQQLDGADGNDVLETVVDRTQQLQRWRDRAEQRWTQRQTFFLQLDGQLALSQQNQPWLGAAQPVLERLHSQASEAHAAAWWTEDGWQALTGTLEDRGSALDQLGQAWTAFEQSEGRSALLEALRGHAWVRSSVDLPAHVGPALRRVFVDPLRQFKVAFEQARAMALPLATDTAETDEAALQHALGLLERRPSLRVLEEDRVAELLRLERDLRAATKGRAPEAFRGAALWDGDAAHLRQLLTSEAGERKLRIEETEQGAIIR